MSSCLCTLMCIICIVFTLFPSINEKDLVFSGFGVFVFIMFRCIGYIGMLCNMIYHFLFSLSILTIPSPCVHDLVRMSCSNSSHSEWAPRCPFGIGNGNMILYTSQKNHRFTTNPKTESIRKAPKNNRERKGELKQRENSMS